MGMEKIYIKKTNLSLDRKNVPFCFRTLVETNSNL